MRINTNISALNAHRQLSEASSRSANSMERLSSGVRINRAGDDAAGLSISEKMRAQIRGLNQGTRNAQDGISLTQTAESALNESHRILQRIRELAVQSASGTNTVEDRAAMQAEVSQLKSEVDRIGNATEFNTMKLLNGSLRAAGGTVGQNTTTGAVVGRQTAAVMTGAAPMGAVGPTHFVQEVVDIDGVAIRVNWQNLSTPQRDTITIGTAPAATLEQRNLATNLIVNTINSAINESGSNVAPISGHVNATNALVLVSGTEGVNSSIRAGAQVLGTVLGAPGAIARTGTSIYNGLTIAGPVAGTPGTPATATAPAIPATTATPGASFFANIGNVQFNVGITAPIIGGTTSMAAAAGILQTSINNAITTYNATAAPLPTDPGRIAPVRVNALADGRFEVLSESGPISFSDRQGGSAVRDLGLTQAQSEAAGSGGMALQIGANSGQTMTFGIRDMRSAALGIASVNVGTQAGAANALGAVDGAVRRVSEQRSSLGAAQNRLEHTIRNLETSRENLQASEARIRDVDMAAEMMEFTRNNILQQAATAMLAQANMAPQAVLQLLG